MSDHNTLPPDESNRIDLETLVDALTPENQVGQPDEYYPSKGRVLEDDVDGTMYLGDGEQWLPVNADIGLATPAVTADELSINDVAARIYQTTEQAISSNAWTGINYEDVTYDTSGDVLEVDLRNNRIIIKKAGVYLVQAHCSLQNPSDGTRMSVRVAGNDPLSIEEIVPGGGGNFPNFGSITTIKVDSPNAGIIGEVRHEEGSGLDTVSREPTTYLEVVRLA